MKNNQWQQFKSSPTSLELCGSGNPVNNIILQLILVLHFLAALAISHHREIFAKKL